MFRFLFEYKIQAKFLALYFHMKNQLADLTSLQGGALLNLCEFMCIKRWTDVHKPLLLHSCLSL